MTTTATETDPELFNSAEYRVPYPTIDGHEITNISISIGGTVNLDRNNPDHAHYAAALTLGRRLLLTDQDGNQYYAYVAQKPAAYTIDADGTDQVKQTIRLTIETVTVTPAP